MSEEKQIPECKYSLSGKHVGREICQHCEEDIPNCKHGNTRYYCSTCGDLHYQAVEAQLAVVTKELEDWKKLDSFYSLATVAFLQSLLRETGDELAAVTIDYLNAVQQRDRAIANTEECLKMLRAASPVVVPQEKPH